MKRLTFNKLLDILESSIEQLITFKEVFKMKKYYLSPVGRSAGQFVKKPCIGCVYFKQCGSTTRTAKCDGRKTKKETKTK